MKLTKEQVREAYYAIVEQNAEFVRLFAEVAVEAAAETKAAMWIEMVQDTPGVSPPDANDAKAMASDFVCDMLGDFETAHAKAIADLDVKLTYTLTPTAVY